MMIDWVLFFVGLAVVIVPFIISKILQRHYHQMIQYYQDENHILRTRIYKLERELKKANLDFLQNSDRN